MLVSLNLLLASLAIGAGAPGGSSGSSLGLKVLSAGLAIAAAALTVSLVARIRRARGLEDELERTRALVLRAEVQTKDQSRVIARMRSERNVVANLALSLPPLVQELNSETLQPRRVPGLLLNFVEHIFRPGQVLYYAARGSGSPDGKRELVLVASSGLAEVPEPLQRIAIGEGKIGWVAGHRLDMLREDWLNPVRTGGKRIDDEHPSLKADIVGPLVHGSQLLGVLSIGELGTTPRHEKLMFQLVTNLGSLALVNSEQRARLSERASTDGLTGLLNRDFMRRDLAEMVVHAEREAQPLALFLFDIDHFKNYNDTNGHPAGDELLRTLAHLLRQSLRPDDVCCRYGGEEFVVAMPDTGTEAASAVAERVRKMIQEHRFPHEDRQPGGDVTISGGIAVFPQHGTSVNELIRNADAALYESKRAGRNRIMRYRGVDIGDADDTAGFEPVPAGTDEPV